MEIHVSIKLFVLFVIVYWVINLWQFDQNKFCILFGRYVT